MKSAYLRYRLLSLVDRKIMPSTAQEGSMTEIGGLSRLMRLIFVLCMACAVISAQNSPQSRSSSSTVLPGQEQVQALEQRVKSNPDDLNARCQLLEFYGIYAFASMPHDQIANALRPHLLWMIEHHPES